MKVHWTDTSLADMHAIWDHVAADNEPAADRLFERLQTAGESLAAHPERGRRNRTRGIRELPVAGTPYLVIYRTAPRVLEILRVLHGARDWPHGG